MKGTANRSHRTFLQRRERLLLIVCPVALILLLSVLLLNRDTRPYVGAALAENGPIELLTFIFLIAAGLTGLRYAGSLRLAPRSRFDAAFMTLFSFGVLFVGMEEISWGQWIFGFNTPDIVVKHNAQQELTVHNLAIWNDYIEVLPLIFGLGGIIGLVLRPIRIFRRIAPNPMLIYWFVTIAVFSTADLYHEFAIHSDRLYRYINRLDEAVELLVGVSAFLYVWLLFRENSAGAGNPKQVKDFATASPRRI